MPPSNQAGEIARSESYWKRIFTSLYYRDFRLVWLGSVTEHIGEIMQLAAILWLANEMTHSALMLTIVGSFRYIPLIFLPMFSGVVADRVNRRNLLVIALLGASVLSIILTLLVITDVIALWHLIVVNMFCGVLTAFNHPARATIVPNLVKREHLLNAISLDNISVQASSIIGGLITGYIIAGYGVVPIFVLRAVGGIAAVLWLIQARIPPTPPTTRTQTARHNLAEGFGYLRRHTVVLVLLVLYVIPTLGERTFVNFMPVFAEDILQAGAVGYGYLQAAPGAGAFIALLALTILTYYKGKARLLLAAGALMGISLISFSTSRWLLLSLPLAMITGGMFTIVIVINTTLIQNSIPDEMRGRIMSWREVARGVGPTGGILFGAIAQYTGVSLSTGMMGGFCLLAALSIVFLLPRLKHAE